MSRPRNHAARLSDLNADELGALVELLSVQDRLALGAACSSLRKASLAWFSEVDVVLPPPEKVQGLCEWLTARAARVCIRIPYSYQSDLAADDIASSLQALRGASGSVFAIKGRPDSGWDYDAGDFPAAALDGHTALETLELRDQLLTGSLDVLRQLPRLRRLQLSPPPYEARDLWQQIMQGRLGGAGSLQSLSLGHWCSFGHVHELPEVGCLKQLTALYLPDANLSAPLNLRRLTGLQQLLVLTLPRCGLKQLPAEVAALTRLTHLDVSGNSMNAAGDSWQHLAALQQLAHLDLQQCGLQQLPEAVSSLGSSLTGLDLSSNPLAAGLDHLAPLQQLKLLDLHDCQMDGLPAAISSLTALQQLHIRGNRVAAVPSTWASCVELMCRLGFTVLDLRTCCLAEVPSSLAGMTRLRVLDIGNNPIRGGWQHLAMLPQLRGLRMSYNNELKQVPHHLSLLTSLVVLDIDGNTWLAGGWEALLPLPKLRFVGATWCGTRTTLPGSTTAERHYRRVNRQALLQLDGQLTDRQGDLCCGEPKMEHQPFIESERALLDC